MPVSQKKAVFTIASKNYLSFARTLLHSVQRHNNNLDTFLLLADECDNYFDKLQEKFTVVESRDLNIDNYEQMAFRYNIVEFNTALKPFFIDYLFNRGYEKVIYLDPDMMVFNSLDFIYDLLDQYSVVLTPHLTRPLSASERCFPPENMFLLAGTFNLGFIAISNNTDAKELINWWSRKCSTECIIDFYGSGYFVDQKWCTLIPGFFDSVLILRHPGCNMAVWNLHERELNNLVVNKIFSLIFYHFSGFNPDDKDSITRNQSYYTLASRPDLQYIFKTYTNSVFNNGFSGTRAWPYKYASFEDGSPITPIARQLFPHVHNSYPYPFSTGKDSYYALLKHKKLLGNQNVNSAHKNVALHLNEKNRYKSLLNMFFKILSKILSPERYGQLLSFLQRESNIRNQDFLLK